MKLDIFDIDKRDKTLLVKTCEKCGNLTIIEKDWLRFITKIGDKIKCVNCIFPEWFYLRSPQRVFLCSMCNTSSITADRCLSCSRSTKV